MRYTVCESVLDVAPVPHLVGAELDAVARVEAARVAVVAAAMHAEDVVAVDASAEPADFVAHVADDGAFCVGQVDRGFARGY